MQRENAKFWLSQWKIDATAAKVINRERKKLEGELSKEKES